MTNTVSAHTVYLCAVYGSQQKKQQSFPYAALTELFLQQRRSVYCAVQTDYYFKFIFILVLRRLNHLASFLGLIRNVHRRTDADKVN